MQIANSTPQSSASFEVYFKALSTAPGVGGKRGEAEFNSLAEAIPTMTQVEIANGVNVINRQLDSEGPQDKLARATAIQLLTIISWRPDGPELIASQTSRLASLLSDPELQGAATMALSSIGRRYPSRVVPILEAALAATDTTTIIAPGLATVLLRMTAPTDDVVKSVAQFMRRPDLTSKQRIDTVIGISSSPSVPDAITAELVRYLDQPDEQLKVRALVGISRSSSSARDAARPRIERMLTSPAETAQVRKIAAESLEGQVNENPQRYK